MDPALRLIRLARRLHRHWQELPRREHAHMHHLAEEVKERALDLRGQLDRQDAQRELAAAIVRAAAADPGMTPEDVAHLAALLRRELQRADAQAPARRTAA